MTRDSRLLTSVQSSAETSDTPAQDESVTSQPTSEGRPAQVTLALSAESGRTVSALVQTADLTTALADYTGVAQRVAIPPGVTSVTFPIETTRDGLVERDEAFRVMLTAPTSATLGSAVTDVPLVDERIDLEAVLAAIGSRTKLVFIAAPNNPTGTTNTRVELDAYFERVPEHVLTVLDQAYFEYLDEPDYPEGVAEYLARGHRVIVLRTFVKKTEKTPAREVELAFLRMKEVKE